MKKEQSKQIIYLDNNSTTQIDPRVLEVMMPYFTSEYGNAASNHFFGSKINQQVNNAREMVASLINAESSDVIFTSGATESINIALKGIAKTKSHIGKHIITVSTEHPAVLDTCKYLETEGWNMTYLPVKSDGLLDISEITNAITKDTILISVMYVNNETGVMQAIEQIASIAHDHGVEFMTDATQAVGKIDVDVNKCGIDIMAFSAHKFYGPKGIGGLYIRSKRPFKVKVVPLLHGGGHERGLRSGTLNVPGIIGMGEAARIAKQGMTSDSLYIRELRDHLENELLKVDCSFVNGNLEKRLYNVSNICFKGADADAIIAGLEDVMISNGSACSSTKVEPSHVLKAMGLSDGDCYSSIRLSLGRFNNEKDIKYGRQKIKELVSQLRVM